MNDVKLAILRTFENTVKVLLSDDIKIGEPINDTDQICAHLQWIRQELSEVKNRLLQLEQNSAHKPSNTIINDLWHSARCGLDDIDIDDDAEIRRAFEAIPIPLVRTAPVTATVFAPVTATVSVPVTTPVTVSAPVIATVPVTTSAPGSSPVLNIVVESDDVVEVEADDVVEVEADAVEEEGEEEEEADGEETEEFEFKGKTYYRDSSGLVYGLDEAGELIENPLGRWIEAKNSVKFFS
jgi:hypothetical protein